MATILDPERAAAIRQDCIYRALMVYPGGANHQTVLETAKAFEDYIASGRPLGVVRRSPES